MEIEILEKKENPLLHRTEIKFRVKFQNEKTPSRSDVRNMIAKNFSSTVETVIVDHLRVSFGLHIVNGYSKIYENLDFAKRIEPDYILIRHGLKEEKGD